MERMMTGDGRVRTFAECRNRRNRRTLLRVSVVLGVLLAAILALLFCLGRFAGRGPFAPGVAQAKYSPSSWSLIVVNRWNRIPDDYPAPKLTRLSNGESVDSRIYPDLQRMFDDMRAAGLHPEVTSAYRTEAVQRQLLDEKIFLYQNEGASKEEARRQASQWVAEPGTSEHELGLAVDLVDANMQDLTSAQESTETQKWLMANSWRYGFIHRYPNGKTDITGIIYEPWHYRYVGKDAAQEIFNRDITLEEYLGKTEH